MKRAILLVLLAVATIAYAGPDETVRSITLPSIPTELKAGEGKDKMALCGICHSLDYITMQPAFSRAQWAATVAKMIKVMGAPVTDADAKIILDYLVRNYGKGD